MLGACYIAKRGDAAVMTTEGILRYPTVFLLGLLVAYFVTPLAMKLGTKLGFVDQPGARRLHSEPIPRSGGISVFLGFHLVAFLLITGTLGELSLIHI